MNNSKNQHEETPAANKPAQGIQAGITQKKDLFLINKVDFQKLKNLLQEKYSLKLDGYRDEYLIRRISYHLKKVRAKDYQEYIQQLNKPELIADLLDVITVNVSYFFRDGIGFQFLEEKIFPELFKKFPIVRIWSLGCSIGAEIYSIAMILHSMGLLPKADLLASDNDVGAIARALKGGFTFRELKTLPQGYQHFLVDETLDPAKDLQYIKEEIISAVKFQKHDLTSCEPIFRMNLLRKYHLLVCRNVLIYFSSDIKEKLFDAFYNWLEPGGILFIGANEMIIGPAKEKFKRINNQFFMKPF